MYNIVDLCNKLNEAGIPCIDDYLGRSKPEIWTPEHLFIKSLSTMPEENFQALFTIPMENYTSIDPLYQEWGRHGFLRFVPFIRDKVNRDGYPTLTIRHNRHLHMYRNRYFQVSGTPEGLDSHDRSSYDVMFLLSREHRKYNVYSECYRFNMLCYAAVIDAASVYDNFRDTIQYPYSLLNDFVHATMSAGRTALSYRFSDLTRYFSRSSDWESLDRPIYRIMAKGRSLCEFAFGVKTIQVKVAEKSKQPIITMLKIPEITDGVNIDALPDETYVEDLEDNITTPIRGSNERVDIKLLLIMLLALCGIKFNWMASYAFKDLDVFSSTNTRNLVDVNTLNDIAHCEPDEF